ncbi:hypothetical protein [Paremcibacter congregatus]|uniref:hypothetical protein n=1 Tax=Paremcibacter congregatus TaxID=2043170 RepID=UPI0030EC10E1|tara:strand:+ start:7391 stop:7639 length:249 start_codon:yes stop_codon:yes gene_type:complete
MNDDTPPLPAPSREALQSALRHLEGTCSELHTIADILCSLTDLTAGQASSCEFALMAQFLTERTATIEGIYDVMYDSLNDKP